MERTVRSQAAVVPIASVRLLSGHWQILFFLSLVVGWALSAAQWAAGLSIRSWAALGGVLLGTALAHTRWNGLFPWLHGLCSSVAWVGWLAATLLPDDLPVRTRFYQLVDRLVVWTERAWDGNPAADNLVFVVQLAFLIW